MTSTIVVLLGVVGSFASIITIWVKDPLLPEKMKERARRRARLSTPGAVAAELFTVVSENATRDVRNARDRLRIGWEPFDSDGVVKRLEDLDRTAAQWRDGTSRNLHWRKRALHDRKRSEGGTEHEVIMPWDQEQAHEGAICDFLLDWIATRRMLIVGEAGAGKSYLLSLIAYHWPKSAQENQDIPVPVILSLASWRPDQQRLLDWVVTALTRVHPFLAAPSGEGHSWAEDLLWRHRLLLLLDGLDEMPKELKKQATEEIDSVDDGLGFVVSCRENDQHALTKVWDTAFVVRPTKPHPVDVERFLCRPRSTADQSERWEQLIKHLGSAHLDPDGQLDPVSKALSTPLMLDLARAVFNPRPGMARPRQEDPAELLTSEGRKHKSVEEYLLHWFVPAVYMASASKRRSKADRWTEAQAVRWLKFLAGHLEHRTRLQARSSQDGSREPQSWFQARTSLLRPLAGRARLARRQPAGTHGARHDANSNVLQDFDWWRLHCSTRSGLLGLLVGTVCGAACGMAAGFGTKAGVGFGIDLGLGIVIALIVGDPVYWHDRRAARLEGHRDEDRELVIEPEDPYTVGVEIGWIRAVAERTRDGIGDAFERIRDSPMSPMSGLAGGLLGGVVGGLGAGVLVKLGLGHSSGLADSLAAGVGIGLGSGPALGLRAGIFGSFVGSLFAGTLVGVGIGWPAGIVNGLGAGVAIALIIARAPTPEPTSRPTWRPVGIVGGLMAALAVGGTAWEPAGHSIEAVLPYGLVVGVVAGMASGLVGRAVPRVEVTSPRTSLKKDRAAFLLVLVTAAAATGLTALTIIGFNTEYELHARRLDFHTMVSTGLLTGIAVGVTCGLVLASVQSPWGHFVVTRWWLAVTRQLPWRLMTFLDDAHSSDRGVLRTNGPSYRFRHIELQRYLALQGAEASSLSARQARPQHEVRQPPRNEGEHKTAESTEQSVLANQHGRGHDKDGKRHHRDTRSTSEPSTVQHKKDGGSHMLAWKVIVRSIMGEDEPHDRAAPSGEHLGPRRIGRIQDKARVADNEGDSESDGHLGNVSTGAQSGEQANGKD